MSLRFIPNALCLLRMALIVPIVWLLVHGEYEVTLLVFAFAAVTDAADGLLAKTYGWITELGKILDPLADKLLLVVVFVTLSILGLVPVWLSAVVVGRDIIISGGALTYRLLYGPVEGRPTRVSKFNTLCQILFVLAVIVRAAYSQVSEVLVTVLGALVFVTTAVSGLDYVLRYSQKAAAAHRLKTARRS